MADTRKESDSLGVVEVPADKLWGARTQRSLEHFSIGRELIPPEMITAYAILKKAAAAANHAGKRLDDQRYTLITWSGQTSRSPARRASLARPRPQRRADIGVAAAAAELGRADGERPGSTRHCWPGLAFADR